MDDNHYVCFPFYHLAPLKSTYLILFVKNRIQEYLTFVLQWLALCLEKTQGS